MREVLCAACCGAADGYKCTQCGEEQRYFDENHECGTEYFMAKCSECGEGEINCVCAL